MNEVYVLGYVTTQTPPLDDIVRFGSLRITINFAILKHAC